MPAIHRLPEEGFTQSVDWLAGHFGVDRRLATLLIWEVAFTIGTDRHLWINDQHARAFIEAELCSADLSSPSRS